MSFPSNSIHFFLPIPKPPKTHFNFHLPNATSHSQPPQQTPDNNTKKKKKRKPRPNFYQQTIKRWSTRIASPRQNYPWEEPKGETFTQNFDGGGVEEVKDGTFSGIGGAHLGLGGGIGIGSEIFGLEKEGSGGEVVRRAPWSGEGKRRDEDLDFGGGKEERKDDSFRQIVDGGGVLGGGEGRIGGAHLDSVGEIGIGSERFGVKKDGSGDGGEVRRAPWVRGVKDRHVGLDHEGDEGERKDESLSRDVVGGSSVLDGKSRGFGVRNGNFGYRGRVEGRIGGVRSNLGVEMATGLENSGLGKNENVDVTREVVRKDPWVRGEKGRNANLDCGVETPISSQGLGFRDRNIVRRDVVNSLEEVQLDLDTNNEESGNANFRNEIKRWSPVINYEGEKGKMGISDEYLNSATEIWISSEDSHFDGGSVEGAMSSDSSKELEFNSRNEVKRWIHGTHGEVERERALLLDLNLDSGTKEKPAVTLPWVREGGVPERKSLRERSNTELAERTIPEPELRRLRNVALRMKERTKVGSAGVTEALVESIKEKWKLAEVVKLKFEGPPAINMKRTHEILEHKTGGLVIWRSGSSLVLYRGMSYKLSCVKSYFKPVDAKIITHPSSNDSRVNVKRGVRVYNSPENVDLSEIDALLDKLGPRFLDWSGRQPYPVDADMLPSLVPEYKPPLRLLPYKVKPGLRDKEMTYLRTLARGMPPHFAVGRNRKHQGLAKAMVKLWEKSLIAKIAIKRGIPNTCNERMAEELKVLTGGVLISRNKEFIVFYRGNDYLTPKIAEVVSEREKLQNMMQEEEDQARQRAADLLLKNSKPPGSRLLAGTLAETTKAKIHWANKPSDDEIEKMRRDEALAKHASLIRYMEKKMATAKAKFRKAEKALAKVQESLEPSELPYDLEIMTDEERFLYRKMGLKLRSFLSVGRRGVFDGTVENMHLHWKYRELVKIIVKGKSFPQAKHLAISLEAESGGVLVSLDKTTKGHAIIVYRGKNYERPSVLKPKNLLTRRQALARSIELQRREALKHHMSDLLEKIEAMKSELEQMERKSMDDKDCNASLGDVFTSDNEVEEDGEEAYLETYDMGDDSDDSGDEDGYPSVDTIL